MFTVGFDISALDPHFREHSLRGIGRYVFELKRYFEAQHALPLSISLLERSAFGAPALVDSLIEKLPAGKNTVRQQLVYPLSLQRNRKTKGCDVIHFPAHIDAPSWSFKRSIVTVLDLIPLVLSDLYKADRPGWRFKLARWLENCAIKSADLVLAISENTARDVHRLLGVPFEKIAVTPLGVDDSFFNAKLLEDEGAFRKRYKIPDGRKIILYVGGIDQRKNVRGLLESFKRVLAICREQRKEPPILVMTGRFELDVLFPKLLELITQMDLERDVVRTGYIDDKDLLQLLSITAVFFFPSLYEGFGLPPLEALAAGTPVVSSNSSAMPEILGDAAVLITPNDYDRAAQEIVDLLGNKARVQELRAKGTKHARGFSWSRTGNATLAAYEKIAALA